MKVISLLAMLCSLSLSAQEQSAQDDWDLDWQEPGASLPLQGFAELALGSRLTSSHWNPRVSLADARLRLEKTGQWQQVSVTAKADGWYDGVQQQWRGQFRELSAGFSLGQHLDVKAGRQILTWGTGDYLFLNDLFPKDWQSFFAGRHDEYLKAPSDAVKVSGYFDLVNVDLVWTPKFDPDNYINGDYFSFFNPWAGGIIAPGFNALTPRSDEWALRLFKNLDGREMAFYAYDGYSKSPESLSPEGLPTFSRLRVLGASIRQTLGAGLFNAELAYHDSRQDQDGTNPAVPNSQWRVLLGYEQELVTRLTGGFQFYLEHTLDHGALLAHSPFPQWEKEQNRVVLTNRLTWRNVTDDLTLSLFTFYSPTDQDGYIRPSLSHRLDDHWAWSLGLNLFFADQQHSFFGQFKDNNNAWLRVRYSF
ncbi:hypothetical protein [Bowmanella denitrificans]|uniref:hypothetical protein n=1 Tax=Bowmanella denitrificans TaxID=366582 RepID=UPI001FECB3F9|nr:hypothetical protein [Bowmanella denitrificans]